MRSMRFAPLLLLVAASTATAGPPTRVEHDLIGEKAIPAEAYHGVQTARALENFQISSVPLSRYPDLVDGLVVTKLAAASANAQPRRHRHQVPQDVIALFRSAQRS